MTGRRRAALSCGLVALVAGLVVAARYRWLGSDVAYLSGIAAIVAVIPVLGPLVQVVRPGKVVVVPLTLEQTAAAMHALAGLVGIQWREETQIRQLNDPEPAPVRWRTTQRPVMDHPVNVAGRRRMVFRGRTDDVAGIAAAFLALPRQRLVILGEPGSGKTALAVLLLLRLLAERGPADPVPVLFTLSGWDPEREHFRKWLARRIGEEYPALRAAAFGVDAPGALVNQQDIIAVLDGLDELPADIQPKVITALNSAADGVGLIVTCRTAEFTAAVHAGDVLTAAAVIEAEPLDADVVTTYLNACIPPNRFPAWQPVLAGLRASPTGPLAAALTTPLMLWLLRAVYIDQPQNAGRPAPDGLLDAGRFAEPGQVRMHLLDALIPALFGGVARAGSVPPRRRWRAPDAQRWLGYLAAHLQQRQTRDLAWWQLHWALPRWQMRLLLGAAGGLVTAIPFGLLFAHAAGHMFGPASGRSFGVLAGLAFGIAGGLAAALSLFPARGRPAHAVLQLRRRWWDARAALLPSVAVACVGALVFGAGATLMGERGFGLGEGIAFGAAFGIAFGLTGGLIFALASMVAAPVDTDGPQTPLSVLRGDRLLTWMTGPGAGLIFAVLLGLAIVVAERVTPGLAFAISYWLFIFGGGHLFEIAAVIACGLLAAVLASVLARGSWAAFTTARALLAISGVLPAHLMGFLEDARRLGALRQVGAVYQFRHAELQDRLAQTFRNSPQQPTQVVAHENDVSTSR